MPQWRHDKAKNWYAQQGWLVGCNFIPSNAINQLEFWQADTFDLNTITKELALAASIGFNTVRVYLHDLLWDDANFLKRIDAFLNVASKHKIKTMFVFFDACWNNHAHLGQQPQALPGVHNSGWLQSPSSKMLRDEANWGRLERYVKTVIEAFKHDERVLLWDLYNEPGNEGFETQSLPLLKTAFAWAREVDPSQPLSAGVWNTSAAFDALNAFQLANSDVISFHNYENAASLEAQIADLAQLGRPVLCTEYMARSNGSRFETHLAIFKSRNVACYNWGLVSGKTQTLYPWGSVQGSVEPEVWFHDIFRPNGEPFSQAEVKLIKELTLASPFS